MESELTQLLTLLKDIDKKLDVHIAETKDDREMLLKHERILFGANGDSSLPEQVRMNTRAIAFATKIMWFVVTPILLAVGSGMVVLIMQGAQAAK